MKIISKIKEHPIIQLRSRIKFLNREIERLTADLKNYELENKKLKDDKRAEIDRLNNFYKDELATMLNQEKIRYNTLLSERDNKISEYQDVIGKNKKRYEFLEERDTAFQEMFSSVMLKFQTATNLMQETNQYSLSAGAKFDAYVRKYMDGKKQLDEGER